MRPSGLKIGLLPMLVGFCGPVSAQAPALRIDRDNIGISKAIPKVGDEIRFLVPVANPTDQPQAGQYLLKARASDDTGSEAEFDGHEGRFELAAGESSDVELFWRPRETGFYRITFELSEAGDKGDVGVRRADFGPVAVTAHDLYFAWFGTPREFRWCNVPTTVKDDDIGYWLGRGALPCQWRGGVCYREWSKEKFVENWGSSEWIAIDEIGGPSEHTTKFMDALEEIKADHPEHFVAVWFMGAHDYWADVRDIIDLFLPEVYLNYRNNHLGTFDSYLDVIRRTGTVSQTLFGLGINVVKDEETGEPRVTPTREDVLRQVRHIKRIAPDMPGLAFFTSYSAAPGVAEYADELCGEYFVKPLVTIVDQRIDAEAARPLARVTVGNHGGMTARQVKVHLGQTGPKGEAVADSSRTLARLEVGESAEVVVALRRTPGISAVEAEIVPSEQYTILDGAAREFAYSGEMLPEAIRDAVAVVYLPPWAGGDRDDVPVSWRQAGLPSEVRVIELETDGTAKAEVAALVSVADGSPEVRWVATGRTLAGQSRFYAIIPGAWSGEQHATGLALERDGDILVITGPHYSIRFDAARDEIVSLKPGGSDTELLKSPWRLNCDGHEGMRPAQVMESEGWVAVTVPFESEAAAGESRYAFAADSPAIEIRRRLRPKSPLNVQGAGDRCGLEQRGGTYACQAGVGGPVRRGSLADTADYRDIYFGYLGGRPTEASARRSGWLDFAWEERWSAGLGVAIAERWRDAKFNSYDVTRLYDAGDWLEITYVWGTGTVIEREQTSRHFLVPHGAIDLTEGSGPSPAQAVWETAHYPLRAVPRL